MMAPNKYMVPSFSNFNIVYVTLLALHFGYDEDNFES